MRKSITIAMLLMLVWQPLGLAIEPMTWRWCEPGEVGDWAPFNWKDGAVLGLVRVPNPVIEKDLLCFVQPDAKIMVLSGSSLPTGGISDHVTCRVQGYIYVMPGESPAFKKEDSCAGVRWRIDEGNRALILWSPRTTVTIPLPERTDGQMILQYQWRKPTAQIGGKTHTVYVEDYSERG